MDNRIVNKQARFDYNILQTYEAGISLLGFEVKAIKSGRLMLAGSFVILKNGSAWLTNSTIPPYQAKNTPGDYDPTRSRRLLLQKPELKELIGATSQKGLTIVPLKVYNNGRKLKLLIAIARGKKKEDKRHSIRAREEKRRIERTLKR